MNRFLLPALLLLAASCPAQQPSRPPSDQRIEKSVDSILARLSLDEKVGQLVQATGDFRTGPAERRINDDQRAMIRQGKLGSLFNVFGADQIRELQRIAVEESHARIPLVFGLDVIHGFRTTFPIPLAEAASWDPEAVERSARIAAAEAASSGIQWTFAPMVDIARDPRWGRIAEGSGEDPFLGSAMAAARVRGFQGRSLADPASIMACAKHYAAYGAAEGGRDYNTVEVSERTFRDVYLPPFAAAVEAGAGTVMASFNEIGGVPSSGNRHLLTGILREEWKFDGFVVSDWNSIGELIPHGFAADGAEAAERAVKAGLDMDMMSGCYRDHLAALVREGKVPQGTLDEAVRRVLRMKFRLGLFADPYRNISAEREKRTILSAANLDAARDIARKSIVLLRNEGNLLPLRKDLKTLAVIGPLAGSHRDPTGCWAGPTDTNNVVTVLEGVRAAVAPGTHILTAHGCTISGPDTAGIAAAVAVARQADAVLLVVGESEDMSGEASCRSSLDLPGRQEELVRAVQAAGKPVVLVLMNGRPLSIAWEAGHVPAILESWFLGLRTGNAVADVVFGDYNPSGRLPVTFPRTVGQVPIYYNHKNTGRPPSDSNHYTSKYLDLPSSPLYPFGFGLSYTTFAYAGLTLRAAELGLTDSIRAAVTVTNTGSRPGDETVQLYVCDEFGSVTRPVKELKAFRKVHLAPGQQTMVDFVVPVSHLAFTTLEMKHAVEPGTFRLYIGPDSAHGLETSFTIVDHNTVHP
ncbi:MAG TPA: glycoside hydrolase family 3 N-terminal domain-containing protein [Bacteroidota bacterium]